MLKLKEKLSPQLVMMWRNTMETKQGRSCAQTLKCAEPPPQNPPLRCFAVQGAMTCINGTSELVEMMGARVWLNFLLGFRLSPT